ncbi:MAG TPA: hypothetical protein VJH92_00815 [Candidatus Nanoarchaeia archaeon]|nr:hypothetical protein [Candidatus Nanoarchaeia archaeon]
MVKSPEIKETVEKNLKKYSKLAESTALSSSEPYTNNSFAIDTLAITVLGGKKDLVSLCDSIAKKINTQNKAPEARAMYRLAVAYEINSQLDEIAKENYRAGA